MSKVVYVTGCLGFIGAYVTEACLEQGWWVIGVDKMTYAAQSDRLSDFCRNERFKFIKSDINDLENLFDCDYVINTAAETHVDNSIVSSKEFLHSNVNGVQHLLELIRRKDRFRIPTLLHFSTDEVYGDIAEGSHTETHLLKPSNPYAATKAAADMLILAWARTFKLPYIIVRPTNNYGIGQYVEKLIPKTCKYIQLGKRIPLHNFGKPKRIWLHAKDTANAVIKIIESGKKPNEIYNISGTTELRNWDVITKITKLMGKEDDFSTEIQATCDHLTVVVDNPENPSKSPTPPGAYKLQNNSKIVDLLYNRDGQDFRYSLDDSKLRMLGWQSTCIFDEELPKIVNYYQEHFIW